MTAYIQTPCVQKKANWLVENAGAAAVPFSEVYVASKTSEEVFVCVVENGPFDAAAIVDDGRDLLDFSDPMDARRRTWLRMSRKSAFDLV